MSKKPYCSIPSCSEPVYCVGFCRNCYQYVRYWLKKTPGQIVARQDQVALFEKRLINVLGMAAPKVTSIKRRRKRAR